MSDGLERMQAFIDREVSDFAEYLLDGLRARVIGRDVKENEDLLRSLATQVSRNQIDLLFLPHGRFHDMGAGRGYHKGQYLGREVREDILKGRRGSLWYSRFAYGSVYGLLLVNLANKYIEEVPGILKDEFEQ